MTHPANPCTPKRSKSGRSDRVDLPGTLLSVRFRQDAKAGAPCGVLRGLGRAATNACAHASGRAGAAPAAGGECQRRRQRAAQNRAGYLFPYHRNAPFPAPS